VCSRMIAASVHYAVRNQTRLRCNKLNSPLNLAPDHIPCTLRHKPRQPVMSSKAKCSKPRPSPRRKILALRQRPEGRRRGQCYETEAKIPSRGQSGFESFMLSCQSYVPYTMFQKRVPIILESLGENEPILIIFDKHIPKKWHIPK